MMILWLLKNECRVTKNLRCLASVFPTNVKQGMLYLLVAALTL